MKWTKNDREWARCALASEAARILGLPATVADHGRVAVEAAASMMGLPSPHDLDNEALARDLEEACDRELQDLAEAWAAMGGGKASALSKTAALGVGQIWKRIDGEAVADADPISLEDEDGLSLLPYLWAPIYDPADDLYDPRIELPADAGLDDSIGKNGVIVPIIVTADMRSDDDGVRWRLVVLDGLQRVKSIRRLNLERILQAAETGEAPPLIRRVPARVVIGDGVMPAHAALNELRRGQDEMTRAVRLETLRRSGLTLEAAAETMGLRRRMAANYTALLKLSPRLQRLLRSKVLSFNLARVLCQIDEVELQHRAWESVRSLAAADKVQGLRAALADDEMLRALRGGAFIRTQTEDLPTGEITRCPRSKAWFLIRKGGPKDSEGKWIAPGARAAEVKPADRIRSTLRSKKYGDERQRRLVAAVLDALDGRDVPEDLAWLLGSSDEQADLEDFVGEWLPLRDFALGSYKVVIRRRDEDHRFEVYEGGNRRTWRAGYPDEAAASAAAREWIRGQSPRGGKRKAPPPKARRAAR